MQPRYHDPVPGGPNWKATFWRSLIAVVAGNVLYYTVDGFLPLAAQHQIFKIDLGLAVDFWCCLFCYGIVRFFK